MVQIVLVFVVQVSLLTVPLCYSGRGGLLGWRDGGTVLRDTDTGALNTTVPATKRAGSPLLSNTVCNS
jgi:hypothetical protein